MKVDLTAVPISTFVKKESNLPNKLVPQSHGVRGRANSETENEKGFWQREKSSSWTRKTAHTTKCSIALEHRSFTSRFCFGVVPDLTHLTPLGSYSWHLPTSKAKHFYAFIFIVFITDKNKS